MAHEGFPATSPDEEALIAPESENTSAEQEANSESISAEQAQKLGSATLETSELQEEDRTDAIYEEVKENGAITADNAREWRELNEDADDLFEARGFDKVSSDDLKAMIDGGFSADEVADCFDEIDFEENGLLEELVKKYGADPNRIANRLYAKLENNHDLLRDYANLNEDFMEETLNNLKGLGADINFNDAQRMIDHYRELNKEDDEES